MIRNGRIIGNNNKIIIKQPCKYNFDSITTINKNQTTVGLIIFLKKFKKGQVKTNEH